MTTTAAATAQATSVGLLPRSLQNSLEQLVIRTNAASGGIRVILLSTAEGVPVRNKIECPHFVAQWDCLAYATHEFVRSSLFLFHNSLVVPMQNHHICSMNLCYLQLNRRGLRPPSPYLCCTYLKFKA